MPDTEQEGLGEKLAEADKKAVKNKAERQQRAVKGAHLLERLLALAVTAGATREEQSGFHQFTGPTKGRKIYVARKGGRCDFSGFAVEDDAVSQISEERAQSEHLGKVRGQLDFDKDDASVLGALEKALVILMEPAPVEAEKPKRVPRAKTAETQKVEPAVDVAPAATQEAAAS